VATTKKSWNSGRSACTHTEKQLLALPVLIACIIVFVTLRR
jgi:hypothetical protein